jgi:hypothetical protein
MCEQMSAGFDAQKRSNEERSVTKNFVIFTLLQNGLLLGGQIEDDVARMGEMRNVQNFSRKF